MSDVTIPVGSATGQRLISYLRFLRAEVRRRHVWGAMSRHGGGGSADTHNAGYSIGINFHGKRAWTDIELSLARDHSEAVVTVRDPEDTLDEIELLAFANDLLFAATDAAAEEKFDRYWIRRTARYEGLPLDGWYSFTDWRFAQADIQCEHEKGRSQRAIVIDLRVSAIDRTDALEQALAEFTRRIAHIAFILDIPVEWTDAGEVIVESETGAPMLAKRWHPAMQVTEANAPPFSARKCAGRLGPDFRWPSMNEDRRASPTTLMLPRDAKTLLRRVCRDPKVLAAFDSATRLYQLASVLPSSFSSASLALKIASVEALTQGLSAFDTCGAKERFVHFMESNGCESQRAERMYSRWRSGLFHAGNFADIDGAFRHIDLPQHAAEMNQLYTHASEIRRAFAAWVKSFVSIADTPESAS